MGDWKLRAILLTFILVPIAPGVAADNGAAAPLAFQPILTGVGADSLLVNDGDAVRLVARDGRSWRVEGAAATPLPPVPFGDIRTLDRDGNGRLWIGNWLWTYTYDGATSSPFMDGTGGRLGPDGRLYFTTHEGNGDGQAQTTLRAVDASRREETLVELPSFAIRPTFGPDGTLYVVADSRLFAVDLDAREVTQVGSFRTGSVRDIAVDTAGRVYGASSWGRIHRIDAPGAQPVLLAHEGAAMQPRLAFAGDVLYMSTEDGVGALVIDNDRDGDGMPDVTGFPGFHPEIELPAPADLVVVSASDRTLDDAGLLHETTVTIANAGESYLAGGWRATLSYSSLNQGFGLCGNLDPERPRGCYERLVADAIHPDEIAPGATAQLVIRWDATLAPGTQQLYVELDADRTRLEGDEANNVFKLLSDAPVATPASVAP